jgi:hypothetical protein
MIHDALNIHEYFWAVKECKRIFSQFILLSCKYSKLINYLNIKFYQPHILIKKVDKG